MKTQTQIKIVIAVVSYFVLRIAAQVFFNV